MISEYAKVYSYELCLVDYEQQAVGWCQPKQEFWALIKGLRDYPSSNLWATLYSKMKETNLFEISEEGLGEMHWDVLIVFAIHMFPGQLVF